MAFMQSYRDKKIFLILKDYFSPFSFFLGGEFYYSQDNLPRMATKSLYINFPTCLRINLDIYW